MRKVSEILELGLNQVANGDETPEAGMCIIIARLVGKKLVTRDEQDAAEEAIHHQRMVTRLHGNAFLVDSLRKREFLGTDDCGPTVYPLWIQWYEKLIADLQAKGE